MSVGEAQAHQKLIAKNPKIIFLLIIIDRNPIHFQIQLKLELKKAIFISKFN